MRRPRVLDISPPLKLGGPPRLFSFSSLSTIEECPRRWALLKGEYPGGRRAPRRFARAAAEGHVLHLALQWFAKEAAAKGAERLTSAEAIDAMRALGGYPRLIGRAIDLALVDFEDSERVDVAAERAALRAREPLLRDRLTRMASRINLQPHRTSPATRPPSVGDAANVKSRYALAVGVHCEVALEATTLGWRGNVDLISVAADGACLTELKTGAKHDEHSDQLLAYACLWHEDDVVNPMRAPAKRLLLVYPDETIELEPPGPGALASRAAAMRARASEARSAVAAAEPHREPARCSACDARQTCDAFWSPWTDTAPSQWLDVEIEIKRRHAARIWAATVRATPSSMLARGDEIIVSGFDALPFTVGEVLRLLGVRLERHAEGEPLRIAYGPSAEAFRMPPPTMP